MEENLKIRTHFNRLRTEIGYSLENLPELDGELRARISAFENVTAPQKGIFSTEERYWITKTVLLVDFIESSFPSEKKYGEAFLASCGYDDNEIERVKVVREGRLGRVLKK